MRFCEKSATTGYECALEQIPSSAPSRKNISYSNEHSDETTVKKVRGIGVRANATSGGAEFTRRGPAAVAACAVLDESEIMYL